MIEEWIEKFNHKKGYLQWESQNEKHPLLKGTSDGPIKNWIFPVFLFVPNAMNRSLHTTSALIVGRIGGRKLSRWKRRNEPKHTEEVI